MRKLLLFVVFMLVSKFCLDAQNHQWEVGPQLGLSNYFGDLVPSDLGDLSNSEFLFGGFIRHNLHPNISLRASILRGTLSADDLDYEEEDRQRRGFNFSSSVTEFALRVEFDIFGHKRYPDSTGFKKIFSPYIFAGVGAAFFNPDTDYNLARLNPSPGFPELIRRDMDTETNRGYFVVPFGAGVKLDLSDRWTLGGELSLTPPFNDLIDGVSVSGDPTDDDWYAVTALTLAYRFGSNDSDNDGIPDGKDKCPKVPGIKSLDGCPDSDQDGVSDQNDDCPYERGTKRLNGCPDRDGDGIKDSEDECPDEPGDAARNGCPESDRDGDGIVDSEDECPDEPGTAALNGCPDRDRDGDGIENDEDKCPDEPGTVATEGCPDSDGDKVIDSEDDCPNEAGLPEFNGCPDTDGDGIKDSEDKCPEVYGTSADGCAEISEEVEEELSFAAKNVNFDTDRASIKQESYEKLDEIVEIMRKYQNYNVRIEGYTDNRGSDVANQQLSERRAQACYNYLVDKGIDPKRLGYQGYGENNPVATNNTVEGRRQNRRVEFKLNKRSK